MAFYIKDKFSTPCWYTKEGNLTQNTVGGASVRQGYSSESEANSAIESICLNQNDSPMLIQEVIVVEE